MLSVPPVGERWQVSPEPKLASPGSSPKTDLIFFLLVMFAGSGLAISVGVVSDEALVFLWVETSASQFITRIYF